MTGRKNSLLRTAYGISPDRNLRDKQCTMRINARANPPTAPQFTLPSKTEPKCLDISTSNVSKMEEFPESIDSKSNVKKKWLSLKTAAVKEESNNKSDAE